MLTVTERALALTVVKDILWAWRVPGPITMEVAGWVPLYNRDYCLCRAFQEILCTLSSPTGSPWEAMTLLGNIIMSGTDKCDHQQEGHMDGFLDWLLSGFYGVGGGVLQQTMPCVRASFGTVSYLGLPFLWPLVLIGLSTFIVCSALSLAVFCGGVLVTSVASWLW